VGDFGHWCSSCRRMLRVESFRPNPRMRDGVHSWCKGCVSEYGKRWREAHPEVVREYRESRRLGPAPERVCELAECGRSFVPARRDARYCSGKCRDRAAWLRKAARR
jgi:hypothetical protein